MLLLPDLSRRQRQPELMDDPGLDPTEHARALRALARINWLSGSGRILWPTLRDLAREISRPVRVLDVASGGGDVSLCLWRKARKTGIELTVEGCDISPTAIAHARQRAELAGANIRFFHLDALAQPLPDGYDAVTCSLFLHHLDEGPAVELLRRMGQAAGRLVLVNDLERTRQGYLMAWIGTRLLSRSPVVHVDGPLSVQGAFTPSEAVELARQAGLEGATAIRRWPARYLLSWRREN